MPLTLTITKGYLPEDAEQAAFAKLSDAMLKWHGLLGNPVMTPNVVGSIHVVSQEHTFSGSKMAGVGFIEWKVPSFVFTTRDIQCGYIAEATEILHAASEGKLPKERIWVNIVHTVDGGWGIAGQALTNNDLAAALNRG